MKQSDRSSRSRPGRSQRGLPDPVGPIRSAETSLPAFISVRGARHNNLQNIDVDVPLWRTVAVVGVSGSGKTSLAIGTLYAEGMQRYLESLSTYSRRRLTTALAGPSGAGKTALVLDSLVPAARAQLSGSVPPEHVRRLDLGSIRQVVQIDASPIGQNARSTPATYSGAFDNIRREFAESAYARPTALDARTLLLQHPGGPMSDLPRARPHRPRRPVLARHHGPMPARPARVPASTTRAWPFESTA